MKNNIEKHSRQAFHGCTTCNFCHNNYLINTLSLAQIPQLVERSNIGDPTKTTAWMFLNLKHQLVKHNNLEMINVYFVIYPSILMTVMSSTIFSCFCGHITAREAVWHKTSALSLIRTCCFGWKQTFCKMCLGFYRAGVVSNETPCKKLEIKKSR